MSEKITAQVGDKQIIIETGKLAKQADGAVTVQLGETIVIVAAVAATKAKEGQEFFPLTVDYREKAAAAGKFPILGVCLGHQAIGQAFGGQVVRAPLPMHGKLSAISHNGTGILEGVPSPFSATRYHSLIVARDTLPATLIPTAWTDDGLIMAMHHRDFPIHGVQFHPESIASEHGHRILANFLAIARFSNTPGVAKNAQAA